MTRESNYMSRNEAIGNLAFHAPELAEETRLWAACVASNNHGRAAVHFRNMAQTLHMMNESIDALTPEFAPTPPPATDTP